MKKINIVSVLIFLLGFISCDLDKDPYSAMSENEIEKQQENAIGTLVTGCYGTMKSWIEEYYYLGEYAGDNVLKHAPSSNDFYNYFTYSPSSNNSHDNSFWEKSYAIISQASSIINKFHEGQSEEIDKRLGELHFMRGLCYFYMSHMFGRPYYQSPETNLGLPLVNGMPSDIGKISLPDRSTVKETYQQVINDFTIAERLLNGKTATSSAYISQAAVQAILSRVYLFMSGTYENPNPEYAKKSIEYATLVINSGHYALLPRSIFVKYPTYPPDAEVQTETILAIKRVQTEYPSGDWDSPIGSMYAEIQGYGWGEVFASEKYLNLLRASAPDKKDARWEFIKPQYELDVNQNRIPCFRFVKFENGSYNYVQSPISKDSEGSYTIIINKQTYNLTLADAGNNMYTINYAGTTYKGEIDYIMKLNAAYPMYYIYKCSLQDGFPHLWSPIITRLAEMYLNRAEAYVKLNNYDAALKDINMIRGRSVIGGEYPAGYLTASNASSIVDTERQLELAFEGFRAYDVYRLGQTMVRRYPGSHEGKEDIAPTDNRIIQLIPQKVIDAYKPSILTQNPL